MAYLSGRRSPTGAQFGTYSQDDVDALRALAEDPGTVDIFLTYPLVLYWSPSFSAPHPLLTTPCNDFDFLNQKH